MGATLQGLGVIEVKDYSGWQFGTFVGYANNIMRVLKTIKGFGEAEYTDKKEVARVLREAVRNGENPAIVVASYVAPMAVPSCPAISSCGWVSVRAITSDSSLHVKTKTRRFWRRWIRF